MQRHSSSSDRKDTQSLSSSRWLVLVCIALLLSCAPLLAKTPASPPAKDKDTSESESSDTYKQLTLFSDVLERVRADYVDSVTDDKLIESSINGMLSSLDPHSGYLNKKNFDEMRTQTKGEFGGLGIEVTMENNLVKVISPIDDTPAAKAGLQSGDLITHIDAKPVTELTLAEAVEKMRGTPGTKITLTVRRGGINGQPFDVSLTRAVIHIQSVRSEPKGTVGYVRITTFNEQTQTGLDKALDDLNKQIGPKLEGYVIDLRNNPGGLLDQAVSVAGTFVDAGKEVVSTRGRHKEDDQSYTAKGGDKTHGKPIAVIINGGSASASEIVAGALQDHHRAIVIGTKSFGKGSVQTIIPVAGGGAMRLTTARYYTPSGRSIQDIGIEPDITVHQAKLQKVASGPGIREADLKGALQNDTIKLDANKKPDDANSGDDDGLEPPDEAKPADKSNDKTGDKAGDKTADKNGKKEEPFDYQLARALDLIRGVHLFGMKKD